MICPNHATVADDEGWPGGQRASLSDAQLLGPACPFGAHSTTKHMSGLLDCPDLASARAANRAIGRTLQAFCAFLQTDRQSWAGMPAMCVDLVGPVAHFLAPHAPLGLADILPMSHERSCESLLGQLERLVSPVTDCLLLAHAAKRAEGLSNRDASKYVMSQIAREWRYAGLRTGGSCEQALRLILDATTEPHVLAPTELAPVRPQPLPVREDTVRALLLYQGLQERPESPEQVARINAFFDRRPDVIAAILGIQRSICNSLGDWMRRAPDGQNLARAFTEIAFVIPEWHVVIPSSRFLKVVAHNLGEFFALRPDAPVAACLKDALKQAKASQIYAQHVFVFKRNQVGILCGGTEIVPCPASSFVSRVIDIQLRGAEND